MANVKLSSSAIEKVVRAAVKASLSADPKGWKGAWVAVSLPGWECYELRAHKGYSSRVSQHPSTFVTVRNRAMKVTAWSLTMAYLGGACQNAAERAKLCGVPLPSDSDYIPVTHPASEYFRGR